MVVTHFFQGVNGLPDAAAYFRLRKRLFVDEAGWDLVVTEGEERDEFDDADSVYGLVSVDGVVVGCCRLRPTTAPYLLREKFGELWPEAPQQEAIWETSRFGVLPIGGRRRVEAFGCLFAGMVDWCQEQGVRRLVCVTDPVFERQVRLLGYRPQRRSVPVVVAEGQKGPIRALAAELSLEDGAADPVRRQAA